MSYHSLLFGGRSIRLLRSSLILVSLFYACSARSQVVVDAEDSKLSEERVARFEQRKLAMKKRIETAAIRGVVFDSGWKSQKGRFFLSTLDGGDVQEIERSFGRYVVDRSKEAGPELSLELRLLLELVSSDLAGEAYNNALKLAASRLEDIDFSKLKDAPESTYLVGELYRRFLYDEDRARLAYRIVLKTMIRGNGAFESSVKLRAAFESAAEDSAPTAEQRQSYLRLIEGLELKEGYALRAEMEKRPRKRKITRSLPSKRVSPRSTNAMPPPYFELPTE